MQYTAFIERDSRGRTTIEFPTLEGCSTFAERDEDVLDVAREALESYLEAEVIQGEVPGRPVAAPRPPAGATALAVDVSPQLSARLQIRWAREDLGISQGELAARLGMPRQQISRLESTTGNITLGTLERVAGALGLSVSLELAEKR